MKSGEDRQRGRALVEFAEDHHERQLLEQAVLIAVDADESRQRPVVLVRQPAAGVAVEPPIVAPAQDREGPVERPHQAVLETPPAGELLERLHRAR